MSSPKSRRLAEVREMASVSHLMRLDLYLIVIRLFTHSNLTNQLCIRYVESG